MACAEGSQLNFDTHSGGIHLALPRAFSASVHAETNNGGIQSDFPLPELRSGERRRRNVDFNIGSAGRNVCATANNRNLPLPSFYISIIIEV